MSSARVILVKSAVMRPKGEGCSISEVLRPIEFTLLCKHRWGNVLRVLLQVGEASRLTESVLLFRRRIVQCHT